MTKIYSQVHTNIMTPIQNVDQLHKIGSLYDSSSYIWIYKGYFSTI